MPHLSQYVYYTKQVRHSNNLSKFRFHQLAQYPLECQIYLVCQTSNQFIHIQVPSVDTVSSRVSDLSQCVYHTKTNQSSTNHTETFIDWSQKNNHQVFYWAFTASSSCVSVLSSHSINIMFLKELLSYSCCFKQRNRMFHRKL